MNKLSTRIYWIVGIATALAGSAALLRSLLQPPSDSLRGITIAQFGDVFLYAPLYVAKDAGFFAKRGLNVTLISTGGDEKTWAAVVAGSAAFGVADPTFVAVSADRGRPGKVIASIVAGVPFWGIAFDQTIPVLTDPRQLAGKTVATFPAPSTAYTLQKKMFLDAGLKPEIREGAFGALISMLKTKHADIALELEPNVSLALEDGARVIYGLDQVYGSFAITGLTALPENLAKDPQLAHSVVCALNDSVEFIRIHQAQALTILNKRFPEVSLPVARAALSRLSATGVIPLNTNIPKDAWDKAIAVRKEVGDIKSSGGYSEFVDNSFASGCISAAAQAP